MVAVPRIAVFVTPSADPVGLSVEVARAAERAGAERFGDWCERVLWKESAAAAPEVS